MKILHILDHSVPLHSGYTFRSRNIFAAQKNMGFDPVVLTSPKHEQSLGKSCPDMEMIDGMKYYRTGPVTPISLPMASEFDLMYRLYRRIIQVSFVEKPDLIHAHSPILNAIPAIRSGRRLGIPIVYEIRAFWEDAAVDHGTYAENSWKYSLTKFLETRVCKQADHICILCNGLKNDLILRGIPKEKITPVFNGINPEELMPTAPDQEFLKAWKLEGKKVIGFVGSFYRYEGLDLLVKAFAALAADEPDVMLLLVGGGEMKQELNSAVQTLGLEDRVVMPGRIPHERIAGVYALINILAYPRYSMRLTELVTPLKPLEAMAMGKVLVASDVGGHKELIQDGKTGLLFKAGDADDLAGKIQLILKDRELEATLQKTGISWVKQHHTWEATTSVYKKIYSSLATIKNTK
ncbi:MAG: glycosyltransferase, exosortase A system-associated [Desulfobacterales bacterium RIFOXYA12_FULL_46_15]|nr:MAG: glycosyltransferase, exosortase A system-associated [Desulfobacula sp. GWF2_41_7]OGR28061.1 MAG: glycosyltransferase, exosortase A system-associated [Desulfobacterales bacterium RIFOXYA12_FULL_46_15]